MTKDEQIELARTYVATVKKMHEHAASIYMGAPPLWNDSLRAFEALDAALALPPDPVPPASERERALVRAGFVRGDQPLGAMNAAIEEAIEAVSRTHPTAPARGEAAAYERAAQVCEATAGAECHPTEYETARRCAARIRALAAAPEVSETRERWCEQVGAYLDHRNRELRFRPEGKQWGGLVAEALSRIGPPPTDAPTVHPAPSVDRDLRDLRDRAIVRAVRDVVYSACWHAGGGWKHGATGVEGDDGLAEIGRRVLGDLTYGTPPAPSAPVVAAIVASLRTRAQLHADDVPALLPTGQACATHTAMVLRSEADRIAAEHPDAEAWAMELARAVLDATWDYSSGSEDGAEIDLAAIVRRRMGGA